MCVFDVFQSIYSCTLRFREQFESVLVAHACSDRSVLCLLLRSVGPLGKGLQAWMNGESKDL